MRELEALGDARPPGKRRSAPRSTRRSRCPGPLRADDGAARPHGEEARRDDARQRHPVRCNATLVTGAPEDVAAEAERWAADGFGTFKLKVGAGDDVAQVRAVREALGDAAQIRLDANAAWSLEEATEILARGRAAGDRAGRAAGRDDRRSGRAGAADRDPAGRRREHRHRRGRRARAVARRRVLGDRGEALEGRRVRAGARDRAVLPAYVASALDGPVGIAVGAAARAEWLDATRAADANGSPTGSPPSDSSPRRSPRPSASCGATCCTPRRGPASASRSTRIRCEHHRL